MESSSSSGSSGESPLDSLSQKIRLFVDNYARVTDRSSKLFSKRIELLTAIDDTATNYIKTATVSEGEFALFISRIYNVFFEKYIDSTFKTILLRCIRLCIKNNNEERTSFFQLLMNKDYHLILICSLENESSQISEKTQSIKIISDFIRLNPSAFPLSLARSLLAVAAEDGDPLQRACIEQLRLLVLVNSNVLVNTECMTIFVDTILDSRHQDLAEPIIYTVLHLCSNNKAKSVINIKPFIRRIISAFTDVYVGEYVDTDNFTNAADSDLERNLNVARNCITIIMRSYFGVIAMTSDKCGLYTLISLLTDRSIPHNIIDKILDVVNSFIEPFFSSIAIDSLRLLYKQKCGTGSIGGSHHPDDAAAVNAFTEMMVPTVREQSLITNAVSPPQSPIPQDIKSSKSTPVPAAKTATGNGGFLGLLSRATNPFLSPSQVKPGVKPKPAEAKKGAFGPKDGGGGSGSSNGANQGGSMLQRKLSSIGMGLGLVDRETISTTSSQPLKVNTDLTSQLIKADSEKADCSSNHSTLFNATDSYSSLLCCALVSVNIVESLCLLSSSCDNNSISDKSEKLLVDVIVLIQKCLPHYKSFEILNSNILLDYVNNASARKVSAATKHREKCMAVLLSLASTFSKAGGAKPSNRGSKGGSEGTKKGVGNMDDGFVDISGVYESSIRRSFNSMQKPVVSVMGMGSASSSSISGRSKVVNVGDLTVEIMAKALSPLSTSGSSRTTSALQLKYLEETKRMTKSFIERTDFSNPVEMTRLIARDGKEPLKWDWRLITDILEGSLKFSDKTLENCFQSKWLRRLNSFYGFSFGDDKNIDINFCMLPWDPQNFTYIDCLYYLCDLFVKTNNIDASRSSVNNLLNDFQSSGKFKFVILNDLISELESLVSKDNQRLWSSIINSSGSRGNEVFGVTSGSSSSGVSTNSSGNNLTAQRNYIFGIDNCNTSLTRDYFTILGRVSRSKVGKVYLNNSNIFSHIAKLSITPQYDYLCRLILVNLVFNDSGYFSKYLVTLWYKDCSKELKEFICSVLKLAFQLQPTAANYWIVAFFIDLLDQDSTLLATILSMTEESPIRKQCLRAVTIKASGLLTSLGSTGNNTKAIVNFLALPEGAHFFNGITSGGDLRTRFTSFFDSDYKLYCTEVQRTFLKLLHNRKAISMGFSESFSDLSGVEPIDLSSQGPNVTKYRSHLKVSLSEANLASSQPYSNDTLHSNVSIEGLLGLPFHIVVKISSSSAGASSKSLTFGQKLSESIKIDSFLDPKEDTAASSYSHAGDSTRQRIVRVRGIVIDEMGLPSAFAVNKSHIIASSLQIGACPFYKNCNVVSIGSDAISSKDGSAASAATTATNGAVRRASVTLTSRRQGPVDIGSASAGASFQPFDNNLASGGGGGNINFTNLNGLSAHGGGGSKFSARSSPRAGGDLREWCFCDGEDRCKTSELGHGIFSVEMKKEPVVLIFSRSKPSLRVGGVSRAAASSTTEDIAMVFLIEVQYLLLVDNTFSNQSAIPRHLCGELARNSEGAELLAELEAAKAMLLVLQSEQSDPEARKAALWALGHICTCDLGFDMVVAAEPCWLDYLHSTIYGAENYNLRATAFYVMGLVGQSSRGSAALREVDWSATARSVAVPNNTRALFDAASNKKLFAVRDKSLQSVDGSSLSDTASLTPFLSGNSSIDLVVLNLVSKLPGSIPAIYKDARNRLEQLRSESPSVFDDKRLFRKVFRLLESFSFRLGVRRYVLKLFSPGAKCKDANPNPNLKP